MAPPGRPAQTKKSNIRGPTPQLAGDSCSQHQQQRCRRTCCAHGGGRAGGAYTATSVLALVVQRLRANKWFVLFHSLQEGALCVWQPPRLPRAALRRGAQGAAELRAPSTQHCCHSVSKTQTEDHTALRRSLPACTPPHAAAEPPQQAMAGTPKGVGGRGGGRVCRSLAALPGPSTRPPPRPAPPALNPGAGAGTGPARPWSGA